MRRIAIGVSIAVALATLVGSASARGRQAKPEDLRLFLRADSCGNGNSDAKWLKVDAGGDEEPDSCGYLGEVTPFNEFLIASGSQPFTEVFLLHEDELPIALDATSPVTGVLGLENVESAPGVDPGAGQTKVDVALYGSWKGAYQELGSTSVAYEQLPGDGPKSVEWSIDVDETLHKKKLETLDLHVLVHGINAHHGELQYRGLSYLDLRRYE